MRIRILTLLTVFALLAPFAAWSKTASTTRKTGKSVASKSTKSKKTRARKNWRKRGQQQIAVDRTREIQEALIREGYLAGSPSGKMDPSTKDALSRYQRDNGWQSKIVPDSRALIKLGLGPNHELLNPETAAVTNVGKADAVAAGNQQ